MTSLSDKVARVKELDAKRDDICDSLVPSDIRMMQALITQLWDENQKQREVLGMAREALGKVQYYAGKEHDEQIQDALTAIDNLLSSQSENNCKDANHPQVMKGE